MPSITIDTTRTVNNMKDYEAIMTDGNALFRALLKSIKGSKWKESSQRALVRGLSLIFDIADSLKNRTYTSDRQTTFTLHERGRLRSVDSFMVSDRIIRHVLCDEIFTPLIRKKIIYDNGASVEGRGISHARNRFEVHLRKYYVHHGNSNQGYILFGDFSKYYDNILHDEAKRQLLDLVDNHPFIKWILDIIFTSFEVNVDGLSQEKIDELYAGILNKLEYNPDRKNAKNTIKKSISIGDQLSQQIGIYYPHRIDNYIKIVRGQKYYGRYMDDWYIMSDSKEELEELLDEIIKMGREIGLHVNMAKTHIVKMDSTYKYLQVKYSLTNTGRIIKRINPKRVTTMRRRLKRQAGRVLEGTIDYQNIEDMFKAWMGSFHKLLSRKQREGLITLYEDLFNKKIYIHKGKMIIVEGESI